MCASLYKALHIVYSLLLVKPLLSFSLAFVVVLPDHSWNNVAEIKLGHIVISVYHCFQFDRPMVKCE